MKKHTALVLIYLITLGNLFCQPDQNYISQFEGLQYTKELNSIVNQSALESVHWTYQSAPGFQQNQTAFHRTIAELEGWSFYPINSQGQLKDSMEVVLPHQFPEKRDYHAGWYTKRIHLKKEKSKRIFLELNRVDIFCRLVINGQIIGNHFGGFTPFEFDITDYMNDGANILALYVHDQTASIDGNKAYNQVGARRPWNFKFTGGIDSKPILEKRNVVFMNDVFVKTSTREKEMIIEYEVNNSLKQPRNTEIQFEVLKWPGGEPVSLDIPLTEKKLKAGNNETFSFKVPWENPELWSPENPNLYVLRARLSANNQTEVFDTRFGFREFWIDGKNFVLNGKTIRLRGESIYHKGLRGLETHRNTFRKQKKYFGVNAYRTAGRRKDVQIAADEIGVLFINQSAIWSVMANYYREGGEWFMANIKKEFEEWIKRDRNSPSTVIWDVENEMIRISHKNIPWVKELKDYVLELDTTRPVNFSGAGWFDQEQEMVHIHMQEHYTRIMNDWKHKGKRPLILGEFWIGGRGDLSRLPSTKEFDDMAGRYEEAARIYEEKMLRMRGYGVSGVMPFTISRFYPRKINGAETDFKINLPIKHGLQATTIFFWPRQDYIAANRSTPKELVICNDSENKKEFEVAWGIEGKQKNKEVITLLPGQQHIIPVTLMASDKNMTARASLKVDGKRVSSDSIQYKTISDRALQTPKLRRKLIIYKGKEKEASDNLYEKVITKFPGEMKFTNQVPNNPGEELFVIPPGASDRHLNKFEEEIRDYLLKGGRILCFKQDEFPAWSPVKLEFWSAAQPAPHTYKAMGWKGINKDLFYAVKAPIIASSHPVFDGINNEFLNHWSDFDGRVSDDVFVRPSIAGIYSPGAWRVLATGTRREHIGIGEARIGKGNILYCQAKVLEYSTNAQANALLHNMLSYMNGTDTWKGNKSVKITGELDQEQFKSYLNVPEESLVNANAQQNEWLIATNGSSLHEINEWTQKGGSVLVLSEKLASQFRDIKVKQEANFVYTATKNKDHPLFYGISSGNFLHSKNPSVNGYFEQYPSHASILLNGFKAPVKSANKSKINDLNISGTGPVAISMPYENGEIILTTLTPWKAQTVFDKELFTTFMANAGVDINIPEKVHKPIHVLQTIPLEIDGKVDDWTNDMEDRNVSQYVHAEPILLTAENAVAGDIKFDLDFSGIAYTLWNEKSLYLSGIVFGEERSVESGQVVARRDAYKASFRINQEEIEIHKSNDHISVKVNGKKQQNITYSTGKVDSKNLTDARNIRFHFIHKSGRLQTVDNVTGEFFEMEVPWKLLKNNKLKKKSSVKLLIRYDSEGDILQFPGNAELDKPGTWKDLEFINNKGTNY